MAKIPFSIDKRPEIEAGKYRVETRDEEPVEIVLWDWCGGFPYPILGRVGNNGDPFIWTRFGRLNLGNDPKEDTKYDLFLITPEPELTDFEKAVSDVVEMAWLGGKDNPYEFTKEKYAKIKSLELLSIARKEIEKDLPRWKKATCGKRFDEGAIVLTEENELFRTYYAKEGEYYISSSELEKLPKEDEK